MRVKKMNTKRLGMRISEDLYSELHKYAEEIRLNISDFVREAIEEKILRIKFPESKEILDSKTTIQSIKKTIQKEWLEAQKEALESLSEKLESVESKVETLSQQKSLTREDLGTYFAHESMDRLLSSDINPYDLVKGGKITQRGEKRGK